MNQLMQALVIKHLLSDQFKARFNEKEYSVTTGKETLVHRERSNDFFNGYRGERNDPEGDIVKFVIRDTETMKLSNLEEFLAYPFESLGFTMKIELSEFE